MPRRSGDQGAKPFELRTGIGGLPTLGGMFRSGDPATIPPHKFHLLVNMRRTPGGAITRPGLALEFDTGIQECIDGLTEDAGEQGGAILVYSGSQGFSQPSTFRAVFPDSSIDYSELVFVLYGPAAAERGLDSPVLNYLGGGSAPSLASRPFIFRGQLVVFAEVDRNGTPTMALLGMSLPQRSFLQASPCWLDVSGPAGDPSCPGPAGFPTPASPTDPPLWPFQHPVGSASVLTYFDNPFTTGAWVIDTPDLIITIAERSDDTLTATAGVAEVLYFVARDDAGPVRRRLVRWDGAVQTTEFSSIPDDTEVTLGRQTYGPILARAGAAASADDWAAYRTESGAWSVIGGYGWTLGTAPNYWDGLVGPAHVRPLLEWGGKAHLIVQGTYDGPAPGTGDAGTRIQLQPQDATDFSETPSCTLYIDTSFGGGLAFGIVDAVVVGHLCYALGVYAAGPSAVFVVGDFLVPGTPVVVDDTFLFGVLAASWIAAIGGRVYVGTDYLDPIFQGVFIHDVTDPANPVLVYSMPSGGSDSTAYVGEGAVGAPSDDDGGEGFQAS